jgi:hypothetical protein
VSLRIALIVALTLVFGGTAAVSVNLLQGPSSILPPDAVPFIVGILVPPGVIASLAWSRWWETQ